MAKKTSKHVVSEFVLDASLALAWHFIGSLEKLNGEVEVDETFIGASLATCIKKSSRPA